MVSVNSQKMAKNTVLMYLRMIVLIGVQLYTIPVVLRALGEEDYGVYNVIGGFVAMFSFVSGSLVSGCQRFLAYAIGEDDHDKLHDVFSSSVTIFAALSVVMFLLVEAVGLWYLNFKMHIPEGRMGEANLVFQFSALTLAVNIFVIPYHAVVVAHEDMSVFAYVSIFEAFFKLATALLLTVFLFYRLPLYAAFLLLSALGVAVFYLFFCRRQYAEAAHVRLRWNPTFAKDIGSYAGWNIIGSMANVMRNQGLNVVLNLFFLPAVNAAHAVAMQVKGLCEQFVNNVYMATRPQMVKQYAAGRTEEMWSITYRSAKYAFFLFTFLAVPLIVELPIVLQLWLRKVPIHTVAFGRCMVVALMTETVVNQIIGVFQAQNKIRFYQTVSSVILLLLLPLSYVALRIRPNPLVPYLLYIAISVLYALSLLWVGHRQLALNLKVYLRRVVWPDVAVFLPALLATWAVASLLPPSLGRLGLSVVCSTVVAGLLVWLVGTDRGEHEAILQILKKKTHKR